ncbi:MAG: hypothetical protein A2928_03880 [Candidatus Taylorbacteria bacterium RIFCSPLOWO2_01_FULL_45_15b]|uniref:Glycosyl transferase family 1 domain-containing protein n=1 Tax=Candidatus Taylorbacteria bacterium RIFCSPLOWO2_01_FULL_45_15b TaxID=1802319 RepID=A0A1G2NEY6_9BACT|nr:MAG: hypothetical protein A2928_03880 [Candidatus Taylorbacteria bacterium RIFCSPLOWO2_01_FULL_45_15b]
MSIDLSQSPTTVLIATGIYPPSVGGPATYTRFLEENLPRFGIMTKVVTFDEVRHLPKVLRHFVYFFKILMRSRGVEIIYAQDPVSTGLPAMLASIIAGKQFYLKIVGDYAWEQGMQRAGVTDHLNDFAKRRRGYGFLVWFFKTIQKKVATKALFIIVPSWYLKSIIISWGIDDKKIHVIYNSMDELPALESREALRRKFSLNGNILFSAGRLVPWKGFEMLIEIMPELLKVEPNTCLFIAGDGPYRPQLKRVLLNLKLEDRVFLLGRVDRQTLLEFAKASDLFLLNSYYEGFSHVLLEIVSLEVPVIATDEGGNRELIKSGSDGILLPYNDKQSWIHAIKKVSEDRRVAATMAKNALRRLREHDSTVNLESLVKIFTKT